MKDKLRNYNSANLTVSWSRTRCIHFAACVRGLPEVFDTSKKPWIQPAEANDDAVIDTVMRCPTGALQVSKNGVPVEPVPEENNIRLTANGPLYVHGNVTLKTAQGDTLAQETRVALCRCGASAHKPYCDGSHVKAGFEDSGALSANKLAPLTGDSEATLEVTAAQNGPLRLKGAFQLHDASGLSHYEGSAGALCRCGNSQHTPFCDGSHKRVAFEAE